MQVYTKLLEYNYVGPQIRHNAHLTFKIPNKKLSSTNTQATIWYIRRYFEIYHTHETGTLWIGLLETVDNCFKLQQNYQKYCFCLGLDDNVLQ